MVRGSGADVLIKNHNKIRYSPAHPRKTINFEALKDELIRKDSSGHPSLPHPTMGACADPGNSVDSLYLDKGMANAPHFSCKIQIGSEDASLTNGKFNRALLKKQGDGMLSRFFWGRRLF